MTILMNVSDFQFLRFLMALIILPGLSRIKQFLLTARAFKEAGVEFFDTYDKLIPCYEHRAHGKDYGRCMYFLISFWS